MTVDRRELLDKYEAGEAAEREWKREHPFTPTTRPINGGRARQQTINARWLSEVSAAAPPPRLLGRWDPKGLSIIYGGSGVGKGVLMSDDIVQLIQAGHRPMIVDYETHPDEYARRITAFGGPETVAKVLIVTPLDREFWKGPSGPLWDISSQLAELVAGTDRTIMLVDSLGPACMGMGMNDPDTPQRFTEATARICPLTIAIGQVNRAGDLSAPFGSVFWRYWSRAMWSAERAPGQHPDRLQRVLLTDRKANNYARADRTLVSIEWRDDLPVEVDQQAYAMVLADQIDAVLLTDTMTAAEILERLNEEVDDPKEKVLADSVRHALRRGLRASPPRYAVSGKGSTAKWSL